jgi:hypothetical protein
MSNPTFTDDPPPALRQNIVIDRRPGTYPVEVEEPKKRNSISVEVLLIVLGFVAGAVAIWSIGDPSVFRA